MESSSREVRLRQAWAGYIGHLSAAEDARSVFLSHVALAVESGMKKSEIARAVGISRQRLGEMLKGGG